MVGSTYYKVAKVTVDMTILQSMLSKGGITSLTLTAANTEVQAQTTYLLKLTP